MSTITIKNFPPSVHHALKSRAAAHGRSLNREIIDMLQGALHGSRIDAKEVETRARLVRETFGVDLTQKDLDSMKDEGRP